MGKSKREKKSNKKVKRIVIIGILAIITIGAFIYLGMTMSEESKEQKEYDSLSEDITSASNKAEGEEKTERQLKLEELHNEYNDVVAWLEVPNTKMSYPIVQTDNNEYYLDHTYKKEYSARGSIFLDKDVSFDRPSDNFLIYGHRNKNGAMFEDLLQYEKEAFYKEHKTINFTTLKEDAEYEILAAFRSRVYYKHEKNVFRYYFFINAENEAAFNDYVACSKRDSMYKTGVDAKYGDQLLTLSTCAYHTEDGRFAIVAKKK
ncbi:MAG: class B sortase [Clostridia bacterium]|jgi:sortase B|nr:class B sortase [Clostridia bacterium]